MSGWDIFRLFESVGSKHGLKTRKCTIILTTLLMFIGCVYGRMGNIHRRDSLADSTTTTEMMKYLTNFGYVQPSTNGVAQLQTAEELSNAVKMLQRIGGIPETGVLDDATANYILKPRCGVSDRNLIEKLRQTRKKRYTIAGYGKWEKRTLTWTLKRPSSRVSESRIIQEINRAFQLWSDGSGLEFRRVATNEKADIEIDFFRRSHYDRNSFDGEGGILAHAFYPITSFAGDLHFDDDENWMVHEDAKNSAVKSVSIFYVAAHELGHTLGLDHSSDTDSLMVASYPGPKDVPVLPNDDLRGIRYLYGYLGGDEQDRDKTPFVERPITTPRSRTTTTTRTYYRGTRYPPDSRPTTRPREVPDICPMTFDTIASVRGEIFLFKEEYMWRINSRDEIFGPSLTHEFWSGLPKDLKKVDSVYEKQTSGSNIMFFIDQKFWLFDGNRLISGYPRPLSHLGLPEDLKQIDATLVWGHNGKTYFFSGDQYWKFNESKNSVDADYPRDITVWKGVPQDLTSAIRWKGGETYFFKGKLFWKFNNSKMAVEHKTGRLSVPYWIECLGTAYGSNDEEDNEVVQRQQRQRKQRVGYDGGVITSESTPQTSGSSSSRNVIVNSRMLIVLFSFLSHLLFSLKTQT